MKTFSWTMPDWSLSKREEKNREEYLARKLEKEGEESQWAESHSHLLLPSEKEMKFAKKWEVERAKGEQAFRRKEFLWQVWCILAFVALLMIWGFSALESSAGAVFTQMASAMLTKKDNWKQNEARFGRVKKRLELLEKIRDENAAKESAEE